MAIAAGFENKEIQNRRAEEMNCFTTSAIVHPPEIAFDCAHYQNYIGGD